MLAVALTLLAFVGMVPGAWAAAGDYDAAFATGGVYLAPAECCAISRANATVVQPDGKLVIAGNASVNGGQPEAIVARINLNGTLDTSFGTAGVRRISLSTANTYAQAVALQADGRIVITGGFADASANRSFVARLDSTGNLDGTFGVNGVRTIASHSGTELAAEPRAIVVQGDGKVVIAGTLRYPAFGSEMFATRLDAAGVVDTSFGTNGTARPGLSDRTNGFDAAITATGAIVVVGDVTNSSGTFAAAVRFTSTGALDPSFDGDGVRAPVLGAIGRGRAVAILPDGRIAIAGRANNTPAVYQLLDTGALDSSFNASGVLLFGGSGHAADIVVGSDGFEYALEWTGGDPQSVNARIWRISTTGQANGAWAPEFGFNGGSFGTESVARAADLAVGPDGSLFAGTASLNNFGINTLVFKWSAAGVPDSAFGSAGATYSLGLRLPRGEYNSVLAGQDGSLTVMHAASCPPDATNYLYCGRITRLLPSGEPDPALSGRLFFVPAASVGPGLRSLMARQSDGRIVYVYSGQDCCGTDLWRLGRLNADGSADATFGSPQLSGDNSPVFGLAGFVHVYPDDRILFASTRYVQRYLANGQVDSSFNLGSSIVDGSKTSAALYADGGFLLGRDGTVVRRDANGLLDAAFGTNGTSTLQVGAYSTSVDQVAIHGDGRIVVAGTSRDSSSTASFVPFVARLTSTGALDASFGVNGVRQIAGRPVTERLSGLAIQPDGKILAAGSEAARGFVARLDGSGALDGAFGASGIATVDPSGGVDTVASLTLAADGGIVLGGSVNGASQTQVGRHAVIKLLGAPAVRDIAPASLPVGGVGISYSQVLTVSGGTAPYAVFLGSGSLPPGLNISNSTIGGVPTTAGRYTFTIEAVDANSVSTLRTYVLDIFSAGSLVASYYDTILGRTPDSTGYAYWQGEIQRMSSLGAGVSEVFYSMAAAFFASSEYRSKNTSDSQYLGDLYRTFFNRDADPSGTAYWLSELGAGKSRGAVMNDFMFSAEFADFMARIFGSAAASRAEVSMVMDFYRGLLARLPDTAGFDYWVGRFGGAQCNGTVASEADSMSAQFIGTSEYGQKLAALPPGERAAAYVTDLYNAFLKRGGERAGFLYWVDQINSGARSGEQVRQAFRDGPEFQSRVQAVLAQGCSP